MLSLGKPVWREKTRLTSPGYSDFKSLARFMYSFLFFSLLKKTKRGYARRVKIELNQELQTWRSGFKYYKRSWPIKALGYGYDISASVFVHWMYSWSFPVTPKQSKTKKHFRVLTTAFLATDSFSFQKESLERRSLKNWARGCNIDVRHL